MMNIVFIVFLAITSVAALTDNQRSKCLNEHNMLRELHENTNHLEWDSNLETAAQNYANYLKIMNNKLEPDHDPKNDDNGWGENLYWMYASYREGVCADALKNWYAEEKNYNYATGTGTGLIRHFTQVVWKASTKVGVGIATSGSNTWIVAKYMPAGNVIGNYISNVGFRKAGVSTPALHELDPDLCKNYGNEWVCTWFLSNGYTCSHSGIKDQCYKRCTGCN